MNENLAKALVTRSCFLLDQEKFDEYLRLFSDGSHYRITAYSPDLRKNQTWLDLTRDELQSLLGNLPHQVRMPGRFLRHPNGFLFDAKPDGSRISVITSLLVVHTDIDGNSKIFAAGRYYDVIEETADGPRLHEREVRLDTRQFGPGAHVPM
jgi:methanesulfonate monooxygenase small subunit